MSSPQKWIVLWHLAVFHPCPPKETNAKSDEPDKYINERIGGKCCRQLWPYGLDRFCVFLLSKTSEYLTLEHPGVKAPGTPKSTPFLLPNTSLMLVLFPGPPSKICTSGRESPTLKRNAERSPIRLCWPHSASHGRHRLERSNTAWATFMSPEWCLAKAKGILCSEEC